MQQTIQSECYRRQADIHTEYVSLKKDIVKMLFSDKIHSSMKAGWTFDCSASTDGVVINLQFSKTTMKEVLTPSEVVQLKKENRDKAKSKKLPPTTEYDRTMNTTIPSKGIVVFGLDPGRSNICKVAVSYKDLDGRNMVKSWSLTRGFYRTESGIRSMDNRKAKQLAHLAPKFETLGQNDATLRTSKSGHILAYLTAYKVFEDEWWSHALLRRESRSNFQRYIGKTKVLDRFFAKIKKWSAKTFPEEEVHIAYGSAVETMSSTGKGEVAVPVCAAFKRCKNTFEHTHVTWEYGSTKSSWEFGSDKEHVYRHVSRDENGTFTFTLGHTTSKLAPEVSVENKSAVEAYNMVAKARSKRMKGAQVCVDPKPRKAASILSKEEEKKNKLRYPMIRGLRFSPENKAYLDRDREAALTIGKLLCTEILGLGRPQVFSKKPKTDTANDDKNVCKSHDASTHVGPEASA